MIKSIIIDDEPKASQYLANIINELDAEIQIDQIFNDSEKGLQYLQKEKIDLLFVDVDMPMLSGIDLLSKLDDLTFEIIFVTGFDHYAVKAFEFCAIGYILKPVDEEDLKIALLNAKKRIKSKTPSDKNKILLQNLNNPNNANQRIGIPTMEGLEFISVNEIVRCEALQRVTKVIYGNKKGILSSYNIGQYVKLLSPLGFYPVHKSHLINLSKIKTYYKDGTITMDDGSTVPLARRRKQDFMEKLTKIS